MTRAWPLSLAQSSPQTLIVEARPGLVLISLEYLRTASLGPWRPGDPNQWSCLQWAWHYWQVFIYKSLGNQTRHSLRHGTHLFPFIRRNELINFRQINLSWLDGAVSMSANFWRKVFDISCFYHSITQHNYFNLKKNYIICIIKSLLFISMFHFQTEYLLNQI